MKQVSQSSSGERMWQAGNGQDKEGIYEVLVNLNNSLNERPQESPPNRPHDSGSHPSHDILWISLYHRMLPDKIKDKENSKRSDWSDWRNHFIYFLKMLTPMTNL